MAASASQWEEYNAIAKGLYENPEAVDYAAMAAKIGEMRAAGTPFGRLVVKLKPKWPLGQRVEAAYVAAREVHSALPPIEWQGANNSPHNPEWVDVPETLARLNAASAVAAKGNPFAEKLAALRG